MQGSIGVLFQDQLAREYHILVGDEIVSTVSWLTTVELYESMHNLDIARLWVYPHTDYSENVSLDYFKDTLDSDLYDWFAPPKMDYDGKPVGLEIRARRRGAINRYIMFPQHFECCVPRGKDRGQWALRDQYDLRDTVQYIEQELEVPCLWSGGKVGEEVLRKIHTKRKDRLPIKPLPEGLGYQWEQVSKSAMDRLVWKCLIPVDSPYWDRLYMLGFDKNGQYTGAANSVDSGNGGFHEVKSFIPKSCGFWHYEITDVSNTPFNGIELPCPLDVRRSWASTALIEVAHKLGVQFTIDRGIVWPEHSQYLEKWSKDMWKHRVAFRDNADKYPNEYAAKNAERSMKLYVNSTQGRFKNKYSKEYNHPDWVIAIIHQAVANMTHTLAFLLTTYGASPVLVNKDALYFLSDTPDPEEFLHGYMVKYSQELRGYKFLGACYLTNEIKELFNTRKRDINDIEAKIRERMRGDYIHESTS